MRNPINSATASSSSPQYGTANSQQQATRFQYVTANDPVDSALQTQLPADLPRNHSFILETQRDGSQRILQPGVELGRGQFGQARRASETHHRIAQESWCKSKPNNTQNNGYVVKKSIHNSAEFNKTLPNEQNWYTTCYPNLKFVIANWDQTSNNDRVRIIMDYLPGMTLERFFAVNPSLSLLTKLQLMLTIGLKLESHHRAGMAHLDFHKGNIMIEPAKTNRPYSTENVTIFDGGLCEKTAEDTYYESDDTQDFFGLVNQFVIPNVQGVTNRFKNFFESAKQIRTLSQLPSLQEAISELKAQILCFTIPVAIQTAEITPDQNAPANTSRNCAYNLMQKIDVYKASSIQDFYASYWLYEVNQILVSYLNSKLSTTQFIESKFIEQLLAYQVINTEKACIRENFGGGWCCKSHTFALRQFIQQPPPPTSRAPAASPAELYASADFFEDF